MLHMYRQCFNTEWHQIICNRRSDQAENYQWYSNAWRKIKFLLTLIDNEQSRIHVQQWCTFWNHITPTCSCNEAQIKAFLHRYGCGLLSKYFEYTCIAQLKFESTLYLSPCFIRPPLRETTWLTRPLQNIGCIVLHCYMILPDCPSSWWAMWTMWTMWTVWNVCNMWSRSTIWIQITK